MKIFYLIIGFLLFLSSSVFAQDGTYDATITTESGSYSVPVEVEGGEVSQVHWPNGGDMTVDGAGLQDGVADGANSRGDSIHIELDDPQAGNEQETQEE